MRRLQPGRIDIYFGSGLYWRVACRRSITFLVNIDITGLGYFPRFHRCLRDAGLRNFLRHREDDRTLISLSLHV